jgi:hypothetical protein
MLEHIRSEGFACVGLNASAAAKDKERFVNSKSEMFWFLRERFQRSEVSGPHRRVIERAGRHQLRH